MAILKKRIPKPEYEDVSDGEVDSNTIRRSIPMPEDQVHGNVVRKPMPKFEEDEPVTSKTVRKPIPEPETNVESNEIRQPIPSPVTSRPLRKPMPEQEPPPVVSEPVEQPVSTVKTRDDAYPVYKKGGDKSKSFNAAFAEATKRGDDVFEWEGREYTTVRKDKRRFRQTDQYPNRQRII